jgi:hypothetical protein
MATVEDVFTDIFKGNKWGGTVPSGPGSSLNATKLLRPALRRLFDDLRIRSLCDAPCGDGTWIFDITGSLDLYLGVDVVAPVVQQNMARGLPLNHLFAVGDITQMVLPKVDAILCRDCLVHLPLELVANALRHFRESGSRYLIATTFPGRADNPQSDVGGWRPLNLQLGPFYLPEAVAMIRERVLDSSDEFNDKSLGVWDLHRA